jgi:hypothetical protein
VSFKKALLPFMFLGIIIVPSLLRADNNDPGFELLLIDKLTHEKNIFMLIIFILLFGFSSLWAGGIHIKTLEELLPYDNSLSWGTYEFLLEYNKGGKIGYDVKSDKIINTFEDTNAYQRGDNEDHPEARELETWTTPYGLYTLYIYGKDTGIFYTEIRTWHNMATVNSVEGITEKGDVQQAKFIYRDDDIEHSVVIKKVDVQLLIRELRIAFENKLINGELNQEILHRLNAIHKLIEQNMKEQATKDIVQLKNFLEIKQNKYMIKSERDISYWYEQDYVESMKKQNMYKYFFSNKKLFGFEYVSPKRRKEWLDAKAIEILYTDLDTLKGTLK